MVKSNTKVHNLDLYIQIKSSIVKIYNKWNKENNL